MKLWEKFTPVNHLRQSIIYHCHNFEYYPTDEKLPLLSPVQEHIILTETQTILTLKNSEFF